MNALFYGDNLNVLRESVASESVDLVYLDPPFNSKATYNVIFQAPGGEQSKAQIEAFEDTWHWTTDEGGSAQAFDEVLNSSYTGAAVGLRAMQNALGENDMMAYLAMMTIRLIELHRVLKPTGSLYLHCDPTASHYLKLILDSIFGPRNFRNEIIWKRSSSHNRAKKWGPIHDTILFYSREKKYTWNRVLQKYDEDYISGFYKNEDKGGRYSVDNLTGPGKRTGDSGKPWRDVSPADVGRHWEPPHDRAIPKWFKFPPGWSKMLSRDRLEILDEQGLIYWPKKKGGKPRFKRYLDEKTGGTPVQDIIDDIVPISSHSVERLGYPTQKPVALLERIISASSNKGDVILDPFCGCGTTVHAAQKLEREWIGIDITHLAISLIEKRLKEAFSGLTFEVHGVPKDVGGGKDLAARDKHEFQKWFVVAIGGQPGGKGFDRGVDGRLFFRDAEKKSQMALISVKGGKNIKPEHIRDLKGTVEREGAAIGLFLTLKDPTKEMAREAASSGFYTSGNMRFPKIQIFTVADYFLGRRPQVPFGFTEGLKKASRESSEDQGKLL